MNVTNTILPMVAVLSVVSAGSNLARIAVEGALPPPIEGQGWVDAPVIAGENVIVSWDIIKRTDCPGENARSWEGANGFQLRDAWGPTTLPTSDRVQQYEIQTHIPEEAPTGELLLRIVGYYQCPGAERRDFALGPVVMEVAE